MVEATVVFLFGEAAAAVDHGGSSGFVVEVFNVVDFFSAFLGGASCGEFSLA